MLSIQAMNSQLLIDTVVQQTGDGPDCAARHLRWLRAPVAHIANQVLVQLARELESQGREPQGEHGNGQLESRACSERPAQAYATKIDPTAQCASFGTRTPLSTGGDSRRAEPIQRRSSDEGADSPDTSEESGSAPAGRAGITCCRTSAASVTSCHTIGAVYTKCRVCLGLDLC